MVLVEFSAKGFEYGYERMSSCFRRHCTAIKFVLDARHVHDVLPANDEACLGFQKLRALPRLSCLIDKAMGVLEL